MDGKKLPSRLLQMPAVENNVREVRNQIDSTSGSSRQKVSSHDNDKWVVGFDRNKSFVVPRGTVPKLVLDALRLPEKFAVSSGDSTYDRAKFSLTQLSASTHSRVEIALLKAGGGFADVMHDKDGFIITVPELLEFEDAPFAGEEFIQAIQAAKYQYTKFLLQDDSAGHST